MQNLWSKEVGSFVFAFRGYNTTNLGRSTELLQIPRYKAVVEYWLQHASRVAAGILGTPMDLIERVAAGRETVLEDYSESITLIVAMELAQLQLLHEVHGVEYESARFACGYSLGEITALIAGGVYALEDALQIPLQMSQECIELARDVRLGVLFSRADQLPLDKVAKVLVDVNLLGEGVIGISAYLSPNTLLVMGAGQTMDRLRERLTEIEPKGIHLRINENQWPPLHTPLVWTRQMTDRAGCLLLTLPSRPQGPAVPILSLVTGEFSYNEYNSRDLLTRWVDHPQRLWDVVCETLSQDVDTIVHVGPEPNIIPATYKRLAANVESQLKARPQFRALSAAVRRPWIQSLLPRRASLLRAPFVRHVNLEDWLIANAPDA